MPEDPVLQPYQIKNVRMRNRIMSTAHEPAYTDDGLPKERYRVYHTEKAKGGIALTMIGGSAVVAPDSPQAFGNILLYKDECVRWLKELADDVHDHGAAVMIQITHLGRRTSWGKADWLPALAPSSVPEPVHRAYPKAMEDWDITRVIAAYADAAERVKAAGLDGLEIAATGHLVDQFWSPAANKREDRYGGSVENRMRFGLEVLTAIRERVGRDFIVGMRMICDEDWDRGLSRDDGIGIAQRTCGTGMVDFVNVIRGHVATDEAMSRMIPNMGSRSAPHLDFAAGVRRALGVPVFHAARIQDVATARHAISNGLLDMVGLTRAHIADPHIVRKIIEGREDQIRPCVGMGYCIDSIYHGQAVCIHNAATGREDRLGQTIARSEDPGRKVVVVGAGPAGLEAARIAAERGHAVVVFEAGAKAGGQILLTAALKRRREILGIVDWRLAECERLGVTFRYNHYAEAEDVRAEEPDCVVIATGGIPNTQFLDAGEDLAISSWDVLSGNAKPAGSVLVYDDMGAHAGMTAAEFIAQAGAQMEFVTADRTLAPDVGATSYPAYFKALNRAKARISLNLRLERLERSGNKIKATFFDDYAKDHVERLVDQVVVEHGTLPVDDLYFALRPSSRNDGEIDHAAFIAGEPQRIVRNADAAFPLFRIGDAVAGRNIHAAIYDAHRLMAKF